MMQRDVSFKLWFEAYEIAYKILYVRTFQHTKECVVWILYAKVMMVQSLSYIGKCYWYMYHNIRWTFMSWHDLYTSGYLLFNGRITIILYTLGDLEGSTMGRKSYIDMYTYSPRYNLPSLPLTIEASMAITKVTSPKTAIIGNLNYFVRLNNENKNKNSCMEFFSLWNNVTQIIFSDKVCIFFKFLKCSLPWKPSNYR